MISASQEERAMLFCFHRPFVGDLPLGLECAHKSIICATLRTSPVCVEVHRVHDLQIIYVNADSDNLTAGALEREDARVGVVEWLETKNCKPLRGSRPPP